MQPYEQRSVTHHPPRLLTTLRHMRFDSRRNAPLKPPPDLIRLVHVHKVHDRKQRPVHNPPTSRLEALHLRLRDTVHLVPQTPSEEPCNLVLNARDVCK